MVPLLKKKISIVIMLSLKQHVRLCIRKCLMFNKSASFLTNLLNYFKVPTCNDRQICVYIYMKVLIRPGNMYNLPMQAEQFMKVHTLIHLTIFFWLFINWNQYFLYPLSIETVPLSNYNLYVWVITITQIHRSHKSN